MPEKFQTILFLVRHGETDRPWEDSKPIDSHRQLTEVGKKQLSVVAEYLAEFEPVAIFTSPLHRCVESAEIMNEQLTPHLEIQQRDELIEYYSSESDGSVTNRMVGFIEKTIRKYSGQQVVAVTHMDPIQFLLAHLFKKRPSDFPCEMSDVYRLVFADDTLVEATRLQPAHGI